MPLRMFVGECDVIGRELRRIAGKLALVRSRQREPVAVCYTVGCTEGAHGMPWRREGKNAMGTGARHAAAFGHRVVVTREMDTEYDGETPQAAPDLYVDTQ